MEQIVNPLLTDPASDPEKNLPDVPDFATKGGAGTTPFIVPEPAESAYIILLDSGQIFAGSLDEQRACEMTENVGGVLIELPISFDARKRGDERSS